MKATDFNMAKDIRFDTDTGVTSFGSTRLVLFDANAIGLLRQMLIEQLGSERARATFLRLGFQNGYSDFLQMKLNYQFDTEMDLLASGPVIHTWEGIVRAVPNQFEFDRETKRFYSTGTWTNSYEAEQHLSFNEPASESICWSLTGYASGWCTAFFGSPVVALEPKCVGKGDDQCEWLLKSAAEWGPEAKPHLEAYRELFSKIEGR